MADAAEAEYEARHATYIASQIRRLQRRDVTGEQLLLEWEKPLKDVAAALGASTNFSDGYGVPAAQSVAKAQELSAEAARVVELEAKLGGTEAIAQASLRQRQQLTEVEALFGLDQARVIREGNNLVIRLIGLSFPSGQSVIETKYYGLLRNLQRAIAIFPGALIGIEGHTDSVGDNAMNLRLSQQRANSVREYLIANLGLAESQIEAFGFGASRPIASNETPEGRAQNRRIDVVIRNVVAQ
jgi:outer membrane protein OmpA-like peptidoglycan-associated protein